jgi:signal transduction histidine kinase
MTGESMLIPDTSVYAGWPREPRTRGERGWQAIGDPENIQSWLGVPLIASGEVIGVCSVDKAEARFFNQEHQRLAESLAFQAAIAIQNARLFEQVQAGRERLQSLSRRMVEVQENERRHIARELHDQAGQALASLMVGLRLLEEETGRDESTRARVIDLKRTVDAVLDNLHRLAADLRPASLDHLGLVAALRQYAENFGRQHRLLVQFEAVGLEETRLSPMVETAVYRVVQEALTNVIRHAQATRVGVLLERRGDRVIAIVEDNGLGFDPAAIEQTGRLGLLGIQERADMLGGSVVIESAPGSGTTLFVEVPYADSNLDRG